MSESRIYPWLAIFLLLWFTPAMSQNGTSGRPEGLKEVDRLYAAGEIKPAFTLLEDLLKRYPDDSEIHFKMAVYQIAFQGLDKDRQVQNTATTKDALSHIEAALKLNPDNIQYKSTYAVVLSDIGEVNKSIRVFRELFANSKFRIDAKYRYTVVNFAIALRKAGLLEEGNAEYRKSLVVTDYDERIASSYISSLATGYGFEPMLGFYREYMSKKPFSERVQYAVCYESAAMKRYEFALTCFEELAKNPLTSPGYRERATQDVFNIRNISKTQK